MHDSDEARTNARVRATLSIAAGLALALFLRGFLNRSAYPYDILPDEGLMSLYASRLAAGEPIYALDRGFPYLYNNYAPLTYVLLAPLIALFGPSLAFARCLSLISSLGLAALGSYWLRRFAPNTRGVEAVVAAGLVTSPMLYLWQVPGRTDPLSVLLSAAAFHVAWRLYEGDSRRHLPLLLAALAILAVFTKQNNLVALIAVWASLFPRMGKKAAIGLAGSLAFCMVLVGVLDLATHGAFWHSMTFAVLHLRRVWSKLAYLWWYLGSQAGWLLLAAAAALLPEVRRRISLPHVAGLAVGIWQLFEITRAGAGPNYFLPFHFFLVLTGGIAAVALMSREAFVRPVTLLLCAQMAVNFGGLWSKTEPIPAAALESAQRLVRLVAAAPGPVLLDRQPQIFLEAGKKDHYVEVTSLGLDEFHGRWHPEELRDCLERQCFSLVVLRPRTLLPAELQRLVARNYKPLGPVNLVDEPVWVLEPRGEGAPSPQQD